MQHLIDFTEEWELSRRYLADQEQRLNDRLETDLRISGDPTGHKIPPMSLQPVLVNAIEHGLAPRPGGGRILVRVRFHRTADGTPRWWMLVRDNGVGSSRAGAGVGKDGGAGYQGETLGNIRLRLDHPLEGGGFWIRPHVAGGTVAIFTGGPPRAASADAAWQSLS